MNNITFKEVIGLAVQTVIDNYEYEVSDEDKDQIVKAILENEDFLEHFDQVIEDCTHDAMDQLDIDKYPMTLEEDYILDNVIAKGQFVVAPGMEQLDGYSSLLWEDFKAAQKFADENPDIRVYTLIEEEGKGWIVPGARWVNRFAYLLAVQDAGIKENDAVRFW